MGRDIPVFDATIEDREQFTDRLYDCLKALKVALETPGFGDGPITLGAEIESSIVTDSGKVSPLNKEILLNLNDPQFQHEINKRACPVLSKWPQLIIHILFLQASCLQCRRIILMKII